jgi:hypothetical protein
MPGRRWVLPLLFGAALVRSLFWVAVTEVPNPIDEIHHLGYIDSLATGNGVPIVGVDYLPRDVLELMRQSPTFGSRRHPLDPGRPEQWGASAYQYEGVQPPLYYLTMVPVYLAGSQWGVLGSLYSVRVATVLLALTTVPLTWLLARRLFPDRPQVWTFSTLLVVLLQGFNSNLASVTNDALVVPLAVAATLAFARSAVQPTWRNAAWCGLLVGLAMLTKLNAVALVPILGVAILVLPRREADRSLWWRIGWGSAAVAVAGLVASTWFLWNLSAYGTVGGGGKAAEEMLAALQPTYPLNLEGASIHLGQSQSGFWQFQRYSPYGPGDYGKYFVAAGLLALVGTVAAAVRRRKDEARRLAWLATCWPLAFLTMLAIVYVAYTGTIVGRHTYLALVPLLIFTAAGNLLGFGSRLGAVVLATVIALAMWREQTELRRYMHPVYLEHVYEQGVTPVWEQPYSYGWVPATGVEVRSECPVVAVGLGVLGKAPEELAATTPAGPRTLELLGEREGISIYPLERPFPERFSITFPAGLQVGAAPGGPGRVRFADPGATQTPMAQIQCRRPDWEQVRFSQRFNPLHLDAITYGRAQGWTRAWAVGGILLALGVAWSRLRDWIRSRREPES